MAVSIRQITRPAQHAHRAGLDSPRLPIHPPCTVVTRTSTSTASPPSPCNAATQHPGRMTCMKRWFALLMQSAETCWQLTIIAPPWMALLALLAHPRFQSEPEVTTRSALHLPLQRPFAAPYIEQIFRPESNMNRAIHLVAPAPGERLLCAKPPCHIRLDH
ncbi:hypothetical protein BS50DRAFT_416365 [Corynespora cassiicola Philippines]|uniref:Uncharacterized protein n=1 Tax=Corynespora cassiicola Philippines TaxID=1448308 RepID=A0A2T2NN82_CORCC|nr:hypothetical protein BS50DRAFT_416365 [Corynespora cassiicola Philippines]